MVQFECLRVIHPSVSSISIIHCRASNSLDANAASKPRSRLRRPFPPCSATQSTYAGRRQPTRPCCNHFPFLHAVMQYSVGHHLTSLENWVVCGADSESQCFELMKSKCAPSSMLSKKCILSCSRSLHVPLLYISKPCNNAIMPPHPWEL